MQPAAAAEAVGERGAMISMAAGEVDLSADRGARAVQAKQYSLHTRVRGPGGIRHATGRGHEL